jgi:bis(5'-nucleosyl)-tetraphosphatase (symmetrical)
MSTFAIGDVQGCYDDLRRLLDHIAFDPGCDRLWLVGDLVNRGPQSAATLRFVKSLGSAATAILGNHDLHTMVVAAGVRDPHHGDTIDDILSASDRDELLHWLRHCPLMHHEGSNAMVHAGLLPQWTVAEARRLAGEVEVVLRSDEHGEFFRHMYGNKPRRWKNSLTGYDRLRVIVNAMTRLRLCDDGGGMEFAHKTAPVDMPDGYQPWFDMEGRRGTDARVIFGHWAALGVMVRADVACLDAGCVWGRELTAMKLDDSTLYSVDSTTTPPPGAPE